MQMGKTDTLNKVVVVAEDEVDEDVAVETVEEETVEEEETVATKDTKDQHNIVSEAHLTPCSIWRMTTTSRRCWAESEYLLRVLFTPFSILCSGWILLTFRMMCKWC